MTRLRVLGEVGKDDDAVLDGHGLTAKFVTERALAALLPL